MTTTTSQISSLPVSILKAGDVIVGDQFGDRDSTGLVMGVDVGDATVSVRFSAARSHGGYFATFSIEEEVYTVMGD